MPVNVTVPLSLRIPPPVKLVPAEFEEISPPEITVVPQLSIPPPPVLFVVLPLIAPPLMFIKLLTLTYTAVAMLLMSCVPSSTFKVAPPLTKTKYPVELVLAILLPSIVTFVRVSFALLPSTEMS